MFVNKLIIFVIGLIFTTVSLAGVPQAASQIGAGGNSVSLASIATSTACNLPIGTVPITLFAGANAVTSGNRLGFYNKGVQYQVTALKNFVSCGFWYIPNASGTPKMQFGYNTGTFSNNSAIGAGDVYYGPSSTLGDGGFIFNTTAQTALWFPAPIVFPASSYPFFRTNDATADMIMVGVEM